MKAGVWTGPGRIEHLDWPDPVPTDETVIVEVAYCGFCGTDASIIEGRFDGGTPPRVLGHEVSGVVAHVGSAVHGISVGDRVACDIFGRCGACPWCQAGMPNHCARKHSSAQGFAQFAGYRPDQVHRLPDAVGLRHGALLEPVANCVHALDNARLRPGEHVLVIGAGPIGLLTAQVARLAGAGSVTVAEPRADKRAAALVLGADRAVDPADTDLAELAAGIGPRHGFDVAVEASGSPDGLRAAIDALAERGRLVVEAIFAPEVTVSVSPYLLYQKEISLTGALATAHTFPRALGTLARLRLDPLITAVEPLRDIAEVYRRHRAGDYVKALVHP